MIITNFSWLVWILMLAFTPAVHAVTNGCLPAIKYLVNHGADVRQQRSKGNITLLHTAALLGMKRNFAPLLLFLHTACVSMH
jgi:ankyrin repeat protein